MKYELIQSIRGYNKDIIIGVQGTRVYTLNIYTMHNILNLNYNVYNLFEVKMNEVDVKTIIFDKLTESELSNDFIDLLTEEFITLDDIVDIVYRRIKGDFNKILDLEHKHRIEDTAINKDNKIYMLELIEESVYTDYYPYFTTERFKNEIINTTLEYLYEYKNNKQLDQLNIEELNVLNDVLDDNLSLKQFINNDIIFNKLKRNL